jgi:hypothetical protein
LSVFPVMGDVLRNSEELAIIALDELFERGNIPSFAGMNKSHIVNCRCHHRALWRTFTHTIRSSREALGHLIASKSGA